MHASHVEAEVVNPAVGLPNALVSAEVPPPMAISLVTVGRAPEGGLAKVFANLGEAELDAFLDKVLFTHEPGEGAKVDTALFDARQRVQAARAAGRPLESTPEALRGDWYIEINEKSVGPVTFEFVQQKWEDGVIGADSYCWRKGYADWVTLDRVPEAVAALAPTMIEDDEIMPADEPFQSQSLKFVTFAKLEPTLPVHAADDVATLIEEPITAVDDNILLPELAEAAMALSTPPAEPRVSRPGLMSAPVLYSTFAPRAEGSRFVKRFAQSVRSFARVVFN